MSEEDSWTKDDNNFGVISWTDKNGRLRKRMWDTGFVVYYDENNDWHRLDGPAREDPTYDFRQWYVHGEKVDCKSQEEFERLINLKAFW